MFEGQADQAYKPKFQPDILWLHQTVRAKVRIVRKVDMLLYTNTYAQNDVYSTRL